MKKLNNKGFVLAETMIVTMFMLTLFTMIYAQFYPLIGEYEKREVYDNVDGKYAAYWIKQIIESDAYNPPASEKITTTKSYIHFKCSHVDNSNNERNMCINLVKSLNISKCQNTTTGDECEIYITHFKIGGEGVTPNFKNTVNSDTSNTFSSDFKDYINYLPDFGIGYTTQSNYRVILVIDKKVGDNDYYSYETMEVDK